jgi:hypothetical protein
MKHPKQAQLVAFLSNFILLYTTDLTAPLPPYNHYLLPFDDVLKQKSSKLINMDLVDSRASKGQIDLCIRAQNMKQSCR